MQPHNSESWLRSFAKAVRERDFDAGTMLFDTSVVSFGTVCFRSENLDTLLSSQWQLVWPNTRDFDFDYASAKTLSDGDQAVVMTNWSSTGLDRNGSSFRRFGRATLVLRKDPSGWRAVHTHFSLAPALTDDPLFCTASGHA